MLENALTAPELLRNKGIRFETWKKWGKTVEMLPSTGKKQYEPNNSWLQNKQIEKGLKDRKDLIGVERVERGSQLAAAEWLPQESRARVTKKSGQDWTSFGMEENLELYLIPEEALLLLELNCLQLTWQGVSLSTQQAYSVLLESDRSECKIDEYRVYSHLVRQGYRLQRFRYEDSSTTHDENIRSLRSSILKRKRQVHSPLKCFGTTIDRKEMDVCGEPIKDRLSVATGFENKLQRIQGNTDCQNSDRVETCHERMNKSNEFEIGRQPSADIANRSITTVSGCVEAARSRDGAEHVLEDQSRVGEHNRRVGSEGRNTGCQSNVEARSLSESKRHVFDNMNGAKKLPSELYDNGVVNLPGPSNVEVKKMPRNNGRDSKLQIISDETLLGDCKIMSKWPGTRIQRNVKWMPKRNTSGTLLPIAEIVSVTNENIMSERTKSVEMTGSRITGELNLSGMAVDVENSKAPAKERTHEIIDVSDDEIEELPQKMSRMEMLNLFPNAASETYVAKHISRRYLPPNVWPQKKSNQFIKWKFREEDKRCEKSDVYEISHARSGALPNYDTNLRRIKHVTGLTDTDERLRKGTSFPTQGPGLWNDAAGRILNRNTVLSKRFTPVAYPNESSMNCRSEISRRSSYLYKDVCRTMYRQFRDQTVPWPGELNETTFGKQGHIPAVQLGFYTNAAVAHDIWGKTQFWGCGLVHPRNMWVNMSYCHPEQNFAHFMPRSSRNTLADFSNMTDHRPLNNRQRIGEPIQCLRDQYRPNPGTDIGESSFKIVPGALSWSETKAKWLDEKTVTIEDEDIVNDDDSMIAESEVKVVARLVKPLVGERNATRLTQVYKNLQIIKHAAAKSLNRLKKERPTNNYRISYNLYSTAQNFKKANPGCPTCRIVVLRSEDMPFIELADVERLQDNTKEAPLVLACASQTTVTFAELGTVEILDFRDNYSER